jgi:hypothetical protein
MTFERESSFALGRSASFRWATICIVVVVAVPIQLYAGDTTSVCLQNIGERKDGFEYCISHSREVCQAEKEDQFDLQAETECFRTESEKLLAAWDSLQARADHGADTRLAVLLRATHKRDLRIMQAECDYRDETSVLSPAEKPARHLVRAFCEFRHHSKSYWNALRIKP